MPTKKPVIQIVLTPKYKQKLNALANLEDKSTSSLGGKIIEQFIDQYEKENGIIKTESLNQSPE